ncbi:hypothetical protein [Enterobacter kobei]|uniref:hypothetical protein n=1 Tax=Enterobacter kobei TaxID=208224 RepID=UPI003A987F0A
MIDLTKKIEDAISSVSKGAIDISSIQGSSLTELQRVLTVDKDLYEESELYVISDEHAQQFRYVSIYGDEDDLKVFVRERGVLCDSADKDLFEAGMMWHALNQDDKAQSIFDLFYAALLRKSFYPLALEDIKNKAYKQKLQEAAKKPRNPHYDAAMRMLRRTWERYPGAPKKSLYKAVGMVFNGSVSEASLTRWAKAASLGPDPSVKRTSFSLVRD